MGEFNRVDWDAFVGGEAPAADDAHALEDGPAVNFADDRVAEDVVQPAAEDDFPILPADAGVVSVAEVKRAAVQSQKKMQSEYLAAVIKPRAIYSVPREGQAPIIFQVLRNVQKNWVYVSTVKPTKPADNSDYKVLIQQLQPMADRENCVFADTEAVHVNLSVVSSQKI